MQNNHFEIQKFDQKWIKYLLIFCLISLILCMILIDKVFVVGIVITGPILILFLMMRLITVIDTKGMSVRFFPIYINEKKILWEEIENIYVKTYQPIKEFGGWGIRISYKNGMAFSTKGKYGIQIVLKNGKKILIGTQKPHEAQDIISQYFPMKTTFVDETTN